MNQLKNLTTTKKITWCPGCGNHSILFALKKALIESGLKREEIVLVSGIGCHGKIVNYVEVNGFHGIHGRVLPLSSGIKLSNPNLTVIGHAGDADQYDEGWDHFCHSIRRNVDLTLIVHNNQTLGLTTGQTTATSSLGFKTKSTPFGSVTPPLNPIAHALVCKGTFVSRGFAGDPKHLQTLISQALSHRGFSYIDVLQPCVTFNYLNTFKWFRERIYKLEEKNHDFTDWRGAIEKSLEWNNRIPIGIFYKEKRPTYLENFPHMKDKTIAKLPINNINILSIIENMK